MPAMLCKMQWYDIGQRFTDFQRLVLHLEIIRSKPLAKADSRQKVAEESVQDSDSQEWEEGGPEELKAGECHRCAWEDHGTDPPRRREHEEGT